VSTFAIVIVHILPWEVINLQQMRMNIFLWCIFSINELKQASIPIGWLKYLGIENSTN
jgi:hypothetical protein